MVASHGPDDCVQRFINSTAFGGAAGVFFGAVTANWTDTLAIVDNNAWPAFKRVGRLMGQYGLMMAAIAAAFTATDCMVEGLRRKNDAWNGVFGGFAAGAVLGLRAKRVSFGVGSGVALALSSVICDITGGKLSGKPLVNDGATPVKPIFPFPRAQPSHED
ncbi:hypothetical protein WJX81_003191 [Elliptochloris bilobata]|uniref:NADH-ubiquinone oxidoreductase subunit B14.7 n=1 Tax=Elliptochloris bilobata TaxID=381761 RepID=A0AAW1RGH2_9CHLO